MKRVRNYLLLGSNLSQIQLFWNLLYDVSISRSHFEEGIGDGEIFDVYNTSTSQTVNERRLRSDHALNEVHENINFYLFISSVRSTCPLHSPRASVRPCEKREKLCLLCRVTLSSRA